MAELSTIARPYAQGLFQALEARKAGAEDMVKVLEAVDGFASMSQNPEVVMLIGDPKLSNDQLFDLITGVVGSDIPAEASSLLRVVVENGRLDAMPEIARQFRELKNLSEGVADAYIETAFELSEAELDSLLQSLAQKFDGLKLNPIVELNKDLIGGVRIHVGDQLLDASIRARLDQMKVTLTA